MTRAALAAGFPDSSSYYRQADAALGMTASQFRRGGAATVVTWTTGDCALGRCLVAQSERGVCAVLPGDNDAALLDDLRRRFPNAELREGDPDFCQQMAEIFAHLDDSRMAAGIAAAGSAGHCVSAAGLAGAAADPGGRDPQLPPGGRAYWPAAGGKSRGRRLRGEFAGGDCSLPPGGA